MAYDQRGNVGVATQADAVTPNDSTVVEFRALYVGGFGDVVVKMVGDSVAVTFSSVPAGTILPIAVQRVMAATTATNIVGLN